MPIQTFPKMLYREDGQTIVVNSQAAQDALGVTWSEASTVIKQGLLRVSCKDVEYVALSRNLKRRTVQIVNDSTAITRILYAKTFPSGVNATFFSVILDPGSQWEMPQVIRNGRTEPATFDLITAITEAETGGLNITETVDD